MNELWGRLIQDDLYSLHAFLPELVGLDTSHQVEKLELFALCLDGTRCFRVPDTVKEKWQNGDRYAIDEWVQAIGQEEFNNFNEFFLVEEEV